MKLIRKNKKGFTLVELIVVIAILAVLALILVPAISNYVGKANEAKDAANAKSIYNQAMLIASTTEIPQGTYTKKSSVTSSQFDDLDIPDGTATIIVDANGTISGFSYTVNDKKYDKSGVDKTGINNPEVPDVPQG